MKAMILAAGEGRRLRPLTETTPKPMLEVGGKPLIQHQIERLARAGVDEVVINVSHLADQIVDAFGDGSGLGIRIQWSREEECLETGGGIRQALPMLGTEPFIVVNSDVWADFPFGSLAVADGFVAHLVMVPNPSYHSCGDFRLTEAGDDGIRRVVAHGEGQRHTFAGISMLHPELFRNVEPGVFPLAPLLRRAMQKGRVSGEVFTDNWVDVGTLERLERVNKQFASA